MTPTYIGARSPIGTGIGVASIGFVFAHVTVETLRTIAAVTVHRVDTCPSILAWIGVAIVDICLAGRA